MIRPFLNTAALALIAAVEVAGQEPDFTGSRELIRQWVQTERIISEEQTAWQIEKQQMTDLLDIYQEELKLLDEELNLAGASAELVDENKEKLEAGLAQYRQARQMLRESMAKLLPRIQKLVKRFPDPLLKELDADLDFLNSPEALESPREVLKSMIAVLNAAGRFDRTLTLADETRTLANGKRVSVNVIYLGLCRAYFAAETGALAGFGMPSDAEGWSWVEAEDMAEQVRKKVESALEEYERKDDDKDEDKSDGDDKGGSAAKPDSADEKPSTAS